MSYKININIAQRSNDLYIHIYLYMCIYLHTFTQYMLLNYNGGVSPSNVMCIIYFFCVCCVVSCECFLFVSLAVELFVSLGKM